MNCPFHIISSPPSQYILQHSIYLDSFWLVKYNRTLMKQLKISVHNVFFYLLIVNKFYLSNSFRIYNRKKSVMRDYILQYVV